MENGGGGRGGRGGGGGGGNFRGSNNDGRTVKSFRAHPIYGFDKIKEKVMTELNCPQLDLPALNTDETKFNAQSRLFIGNLPRDFPYDELKEMFSKYGELGQIYFNKDGAYAFINFDFKSNAEKAKNELQGKVLKGRPVKIRFGSISSGVKVKNLTPYVSNELLHKAFSVFGDIESCKVIVDDRGKATGDGEVVFTEKKGATIALKKCQEECYFLTSSLRPVIVEPLEPKDEDEGNPELSMHKNEHYRSERKEGPRFAERNSFEYEYGIRWKRLYEMYKEKKMLLESDLQAEMEQLETRFAMVRHEHETEKLRRELMQREAEAARYRQYTQERYGGGGGGGYYDRGYDGGSQDGYQGQGGQDNYQQGGGGDNSYQQQMRERYMQQQQGGGNMDGRYQGNQNQGGGNQGNMPDDQQGVNRGDDNSQQGGVNYKREQLQQQQQNDDVEMKRARY